MSKRNLYVLLYIIGIVVSVGAGMGVKNFPIALLLLFVIRFGVNFWYANLNGVSLAPKILASIFSGCGFVYLMGLDKNLPGAWAILDDTIKIYEKNFKNIIIYPLWQFLGVAALVILGVIIWILASFLSLIPRYIIVIVFSVIIFIAIIILSLLLTIGLYYTIKRTTDGQPNMPVKETLRLAWTKLSSFLGSAILGHLYAIWPLLAAIILGAIYATTSMAYSLGGLNTGALLQGNWIFGAIVAAAVVYGIIHFVYYSIRLIFNYLSVLFANQKATESLTYSKALTKNHWWAVLWRMHAPAWVVAVVVIIASFVVDIFSLFGPVGEAISSILYLVLQVIATPLVGIILIILFNHLERQKTSPPVQS